MLSNGKVLAESMCESYENQEKFIGSINEFNVKLISVTPASRHEVAAVINASA